MAKDYKAVTQNMAEAARRENAEREARQAAGVPFPVSENFVPEVDEGDA